MCLKNPYEDEAAIEKTRRDYVFYSKSNEYNNKETSWKRGDNRNIIGLSRGRSDVFSRKLDIIGKGRELHAQAVKEYHMKDSIAKAAEGGRSATAGRRDYIALLDKSRIIQNKIGNTLGKDAAAAEQGLIRQFRNKQAVNREALGLPPVYGPPVMERQASLWEQTAPIREAAEFAISMATGIPAAKTALTE